MYGGSGIAVSLMPLYAFSSSPSLALPLSLEAVRLVRGVVSVVTFTGSSVNDARLPSRNLFPPVVVASISVCALSRPFFMPPSLAVARALW